LLLVSILVSPGAAKQTGSISPFIDRQPMIHYAEMRAQAGLIFEKKWLLRPELTHSSLTGGYPFEETPAGAFLSERF
jgi:hypothetical protein